MGENWISLSRMGDAFESEINIACAPGAPRAQAWRWRWIGEASWRPGLPPNFPSDMGSLTWVGEETPEINYMLGLDRKRLN